MIVAQHIETVFKTGIQSVHTNTNEDDGPDSNDDAEGREQGAEFMFGELFAGNAGGLFQVVYVASEVRAWHGEGLPGYGGVAFDDSIAEANESAGVLGDVFFMGYEYNRIAL